MRPRLSPRGLAATARQCGVSVPSLVSPASLPSRARRCIRALSQSQPLPPATAPTGTSPSDADVSTPTPPAPCLWGGATRPQVSAKAGGEIARPHDAVFPLGAAPAVSAHTQSKLSHRPTPTPEPFALPVATLGCHVTPAAPTATSTTTVRAAVCTTRLPGALVTAECCVPAIHTPPTTFPPRTATTVGLSAPPSARLAYGGTPAATHAAPKSIERTAEPNTPGHRGPRRPPRTRSRGRQHGPKQRGRAQEAVSGVNVRLLTRGKRRIRRLMREPHRRPPSPLMQQRLGWLRRRRRGAGEGQRVRLGRGRWGRRGRVRDEARCMGDGGRR